MTSRARRPPAYAGYALDLDGTVYLGEALLPGAAETITALRARGSRLVFLTNNPTRSPAAYAARLTALGVPSRAADVLTSSGVMIAYLARRWPGARVFAIGEPSFLNELRAAGVALVDDPAQVDLVVAAFDRTFSYDKLQGAFDAIRRGAAFVATNRDPYCPIPGGGLPDCGAIVAAIEACTGRAVQDVVGKPSMVMAQAVLERLALPPAATLMVGDRLHTDIAMGARAGMHTALVLTGATTPADLAGAPVAPEFVLDDLRGLLAAPRRSERAG